jgi:hypothetical protein
MDQPARPFTSEGDTPRWIGRLIIAVLLGEATWGLIVSFMNHVFVPWLGDVMGQSSGLPTSFTQRPYNYPELFVSIFEFCIAGLVAAVLNYFFQRSPARKIKTVRGPVAVSPVPVTPVQFLPTIPQPPARVAPVEDAVPVPAPPAPVALAEPIVAPAPVRVVPPQPAPSAVPPTAKQVAVSTPPPPVVTPVAAKPPTPKAEPAKPKKPKEVYYNIVGEPMPSDDD